ncbi:hypothetical protein G2W53_021203 [Senna tora]|uniref:Uncharacterized protein n=1 Tax=Senna tora TaxID=362788 RepID=A0A834TKZ6_9FABA|nr:hypothetical protein G2W53_021203 [Senna tora]
MGDEGGEVGGGLSDGERKKVVAVDVKKMRGEGWWRREEIRREGKEMEKREGEGVMERGKEGLEEVVSGRRKMEEEDALDGRAEKPWEVKESERKRG